MSIQNSLRPLVADAHSLDRLKRDASASTASATRESAKEFEALLVNMLVKSMREAAPHEGVFDNEQTKMFGAMLDQQLSHTVASRGIGLADVIERQLSGPSK